MADLKLVTGLVPADTPYPATFNEFLEKLSSYLTLQYPDEFRYAVVSSAAPTGPDVDKIWFKLSSVDGSPESVNIYIDGNWVEFSPLQFGDMVLVADTSVIISPWGEGQKVYTVRGEEKITPTTPTAPAGYKYKIYVGNYS